MEPRVLRLGRGDFDKEGRRNDIQVNHDSVSRSHLEIFIDPNGIVFITDLQTRNGTFVNGVPVVGNTMLMPGDKLKVGSANPLQWERWINGHYEEDSLHTTGNIEPAIPSRNHHVYSTTTGNTQKSRNNSWVLPLLIMLAGIAVTFIIVNNKNGSNSVKAKSENDSKSADGVYTLDALRSKSYDELRQLSNQRPIVSGLNNGTRLWTLDHKEVVLQIYNSTLVSVDELMTSSNIPMPAPAITTAEPDNSETELSLPHTETQQINVESDTTASNRTYTDTNKPGSIKISEYTLPGGEDLDDFIYRISKNLENKYARISNASEIIKLNSGSFSSEEINTKFINGNKKIYFLCYPGE